eukprot:1998548-Amphidinium_carterae.1
MLAFIYVFIWVVKEVTCTCTVCRHRLILLSFHQVLAMSVDPYMRPRLRTSTSQSPLAGCVQNSVQLSSYRIAATSMGPIEFHIAQTSQKYAWSPNRNNCVRQFLLSVCANVTSKQSFPLHMYIFMWLRSVKNYSEPRVVLVWFPLHSVTFRSFAAQCCLARRGGGYVAGKPLSGLVSGRVLESA